jgi:hypothetical protein
MRKTIALARNSADYARLVIVLACGGALIVAGQALPLSF